MSQSSDFIDKILKASQKQKAHLALPEADDPRVLEASRLLLGSNAVSQLTLFADQIPSDLSSDKRVHLVRPGDLVSQTAAHVTARAEEKKKSLKPGEADELSQSPLSQAAMLLAQGKVDAVVAGCAHTTADVIRASLKGVGMAPGLKTMSGAFVMLKGEEQFIFADCGVVIEPTIEQLADIAQSSVATYQKLFPETEPRVAFLSFSTKGSAEHPWAEKMSQAAAIFQKRCPEIKADGELQFDAAYVPGVAERKAPGGAVGGRANIFIFPDLGAGNISYKIAQRLGGFEAFGPILQGSLKPYLDLSRGASAQDIYVSSLIALSRV